MDGSNHLSSYYRRKTDKSRKRSSRKEIPPPTTQPQDLPADFLEALPEFADLVRKRRPVTTSRKQQCSTSSDPLQTESSRSSSKAGPTLPSTSSSSASLGSSAILQSISRSQGGFMSGEGRFISLRQSSARSRLQPFPGEYQLDFVRRQSTSSQQSSSSTPPSAPEHRMEPPMIQSLPNSKLPSMSSEHRFAREEPLPQPSSSQRNRSSQDAGLPLEVEDKVQFQCPFVFDTSFDWNAISREQSGADIDYSSAGQEPPPKRTRPSIDHADIHPGLPPEQDYSEPPFFEDHSDLSRILGLDSPEAVSSIPSGELLNTTMFPSQLDVAFPSQIVTTAETQHEPASDRTTLYLDQAQALSQLSQGSNALWEFGNGDAEGSATPQDLDSKPQRLCEGCLMMSIKCEFEPTDPEGPCKRCKKANRPCDMFESGSELYGGHQPANHAEVGPGLERWEKVTDDHGKLKKKYTRPTRLRVRERAFSDANYGPVMYRLEKDNKTVFHKVTDAEGRSTLTPNNLQSTEMPSMHNSIDSTQGLDINSDQRVDVDLCRARNDQRKIREYEPCSFSSVSERTTHPDNLPFLFAPPEGDSHAERFPTQAVVDMYSEQWQRAYNGAEDGSLSIRTENGENFDVTQRNLRGGFRSESVGHSQEPSTPVTTMDMPTTTLRRSPRKHKTKLEGLASEKLPVNNNTKTRSKGKTGHGAERTAARSCSVATSISTSTLSSLSSISEFQDVSEDEEEDDEEGEWSEPSKISSRRPSVSKKKTTAVSRKRKAETLDLNSSPSKRAKPTSNAVVRRRNAPKLRKLAFKGTRAIVEENLKQEAESLAAANQKLQAQMSHETQFDALQYSDGEMHNLVIPSWQRGSLINNYQTSMGMAGPEAFSFPRPAVCSMDNGPSQFIDPRLLVSSFRDTVSAEDIIQERFRRSSEDADAEEEVTNTREDSVVVLYPELKIKAEQYGSGHVRKDSGVDVGEEEFGKGLDVVDIGEDEELEGWYPIDTRRPWLGRYRDLREWEVEDIDELMDGDVYD